jgi:hypothetical protein
MTSPINLPKNTSSSDTETTGNEAAHNQKKRSAPGCSNMLPSYSPEIIQAAPSLNTNNGDQVFERPAKMQRRGAMSTSSKINETNLQPSQSGIDRATDDVADLLAGSNLADKKLKK